MAPKRQALSIVLGMGKKPGASDSDSDESSDSEMGDDDVKEARLDACKEMLAAFKAGSADRLDDALTTYVSLCHEDKSYGDSDDDEG